MLKNITKDIVLAGNLIIRKKILGKSFGLMFHKKLEDTAMLFLFKKEKLVSLHMFFVLFPIDVVYLNSLKEVVEIKENLAPFSVYTPKKKARYIIELPAGTIKKTETEIGDKILLG